MATATRPARRPTKPARPARPRSPRPPMDARIHQRRREVRQASQRRRRRVIVGVLLVVAGAGAAVGITRSPLFAITGVRVEGVDGGQAQIVKEAADVARGQNLMTANLDGALSSTRALPWVASAEVNREPPSTVVIEVVPRKPVAILAGSQGKWLVDRDGVVIAEAGEELLPRIDLTSTAPAVPGVAVADPAAHNALQLYAAVPADIRAAMLVVQAEGVRTVRVRLALDALDSPSGYRKDTATWVRLGTAGDIDEQLAVLRALLQQLRDTKQPVPAQIDVRVPSNPVVVP